MDYHYFASVGVTCPSKIRANCLPKPKLGELFWKEMHVRILHVFGL